MRKNMKSLIIISLFLSPIIGFSQTVPEKSPANEVAEGSAKKAFDAVKKNLKNKKFSDSVAMLMTMKAGFNDMRAFLKLCDTNLVSDDEASRSAALLCGEAVNSLHQAGQLQKWTSEKQLDAVDKYDWKNGPELKRLAEEPGYLTKRMPSYEAFMVRAAAAPK